MKLKTEFLNEIKERGFIYQNTEIEDLDNLMSKNKIFIFVNMLIFSIFIMSCSSQEYTTAKLAIQQSDFSKASEWLPKAMEVEPDNPEIPMVMAIEIHAQNEDWNEMIALFDRAMGINSEKVVEIRGAFISVKEAVSNYVEFYWAKEFNERCTV